MSSNQVRAGGKAAGSRNTRGNSSSKAAPPATGRGVAARKSGRDVLREPGRPVRAPRPAPEGVRVGWREAIAATVAGLGFDVVDVERAPRGLLRITIDRQPGRTYAEPGEFITVEDCEQVTRQLQYALEVEGLEYSRLEVSSPGLDRPLKSEADYARFAGQAVSLVLKAPFQGRKNWQGVLLRSDAAAAEPADVLTGDWKLVFMESKAEHVLGFRFDEVREARLVPVVDFKGRKGRSDAVDGGQDGATSEVAAPGTDGG